MPQEVRLWRIDDGDRLAECPRAPLDLESRLEEWLAQDISILSPDLMVIGRQVETAYGGFIDLLCIDRSADLVVVELKRNKTPREITAQTLDYASWVSELSPEVIEDIAAKYLGNGTSLEGAFRSHFGEELPDSVNDAHRMLIVAANIDPSSERIIKYLSNAYGVNINAVTFHYFKADDGREFIARVFLIDPEEVEDRTRVRSPPNRRPNLSHEELEQLAVQNSVDDQYRRLVSGLGEHLSKHTTRSSVCFAGVFDKSRKTVISLLPGESDQQNGLRFQIYFGRFRQIFGFSEDQALALLPVSRVPWQYYGSASPDYSGFQGYFANLTEVDRLLQGIAQKGIIA